MTLYELIKENKGLNFIDPDTKKNNSISDFHNSLVIQDLKRLVFIYGNNQITSIEVFLNFLRSKCTISLLSRQVNNEFKENIEKEYQPYYIYDPSRNKIKGYELCDKNVRIKGLFKIKKASDYKIDENIKFLLSTSGTTGTPKFVKLSEENLIANTKSILDYIPIKEDDVVPLNIPFVFVYGLSILLTNCIKGGSIICTDKDVLKKEFWEDFNTYNCTSISGVPYVYEMLYRIGFFKKTHTSLRYLNQAGGALNLTLIKHISAYALENKIPFYVQYGQTEAGGRMSFLHPSNLPEKAGSIGKPISGGKFEIDIETSELIYSGNSIYGGYARNKAALSFFKKTNMLKTGDLAKKDKQGFFYITGRIKRIMKMFGNRLNLDEIELILKNNLEGQTFACVGLSDKYLSVMHMNAQLPDKAIRNILKEKLKLHPNSIKITCETIIPLTPSGKVNYEKIKEKLREQTQNS